MALTKAHFRMIEGSEVNVRDFGAVGDGVTDDTAAIQAALDYANAKSGAKPKVFAPSGIYLISSTVTLYSEVPFHGEGYGSSNNTTFKAADGMNATMFTTQTSTFSQHYDLRNFNLDGNKSNQSAGSYHGLYLYWWDIANTIDNIRVADVRGKGVLFDNTGTQTGNAIASNIITVRCDLGGIGIDGPVQSFLLTHCSAEGCGLSAGSNFVFENINDTSVITLLSCRGEGRTLVNGGGQRNIACNNFNGGLLNIIGGSYNGVASNILAEQIKVQISIARITASGVRWPDTVTGPSSDVVINDAFASKTLNLSDFSQNRTRDIRWNTDVLYVASQADSSLMNLKDGSGNLVSVTGTNATPEGAISASPGSLHYRSSGGSAGALYVKRSGTGNTGWIKLPRPSTQTFGDSAATLQVSVNAETNIWASPITANRAVTLSTTEAISGSKFRIVRQSSATGAFTIDVGTGPLKSLAAGEWCDVEYNGTSWLLTAFGSGV